MFYGIENVKEKNFFLLCDAIAASHQPTRNSLVNNTNLSYPTVSKTVESLLDMGIITEKLSGKNYVYSFNKRYYLAVADLRGRFYMSFTDLGGNELYGVTHKESDEFFFDEKLSLFFRNGTILAKRKFPKGKLAGICVLLPSLSQDYRDTRGILSSPKRMSKLISCYFNDTNIRLTTAIDAAADMSHNKRAMIIMKEPCGIICRAAGYGCNNTALLKSVTTTSLGKCTTSRDLATEIALAVGNLYSVLTPYKICIDGDGLFSVSAFPKHFKEALATFICVEEERLAEIIHTDGSLAITAGASLLRRDLINNLLNRYRERNIYKHESIPDEA